MEERFLVNYDDDKQQREVFDSEMNQFLNFYETVSLLNKQDEKIQELERRLEQSVQSQWYIDLDRLKKNKDFEKSQNSKAIDVLKNIRRYFNDFDNYSIHTPFEILYQIDNQIKELGGGENE